MAPAENAEGRAAAKRSDERDQEGEGDYADAVVRHAKYLGIDPKHDARYTWIAEEVCTRTSTSESIQPYLQPVEHHACGVQ